MASPKALLWCGALAISGAIIGNALFLQSSRHPSPFFAAEPSMQSAAQPDELVRAVQEALRTGGYYGGAVDGIAGPQTAEAIVAFERISGRAVTGRASPELLEAMRAEAVAQPAPAEDPLPPPAAPPPADPRVAKVQAALSRAAYGQIKADGVLGPQTRDAVMQFQADHGLPATGEIDDALLVELAAAGALEGE